MTQVEILSTTHNLEKGTMFVGMLTVFESILRQTTCEGFSSLMNLSHEKNITIYYLEQTGADWITLFLFNFVCRQNIENNWRCGQHELSKIQCHSENSKGVYCLQYDDQKIVSGLRDNTIKVGDN